LFSLLGAREPDQTNSKCSQTTILTSTPPPELVLSTVTFPPVTISQDPITSTFTSISTPPPELVLSTLTEPSTIVSFLFRLSARDPDQANSKLFRRRFLHRPHRPSWFLVL
jgi:hypothetical protein